MSVRAAHLPATRAVNTPDAAMLPLLYRTEQRYGWSVGMRAVTLALLSGCALPHGPVIELGCGGGRLLSELRGTFPDRALYGVDLHPHALAHAAVAVESCASLGQAHLHELPFPDGAFALCLALDAFDQRGVQLDRALAESCRILRPDGILLLRVSAYSWLEGPHDIAFNTGHRYEKHDIMQELQQANLVPVRVTFANMLLSGPAGALRLLQRWRLLPFLPSLYTTRILNALLAAALAWEAKWLRAHDLPGGMSLYVVARRSPGRGAVRHGGLG